MDANKVVMHKMQRDTMGVVLGLLRECIGEPRGPTLLHPQCEIAPLDVGRADVLRIRLTLNPSPVGPDGLRRAIPLLAFRRLPLVAEPRSFRIAFWQPNTKLTNFPSRRIQSKLNLVNARF